VRCPESYQWLSSRSFLDSWEREEVFAGSQIVEDFWFSGPKPTSEPNEEGEFDLGSMFEATREYIGKEHSGSFLLPKF
jgi:hypothetical protein